MRLAVAGLPQLVHDIRLRQAHTGVQLQRAGIDARRHRKAPALELAAHLKVEVQCKAGRKQGNGEQGVAEVSPDFLEARHELDFTLKVRWPPRSRSANSYMSSRDDSKVVGE